MNGIDVVVFYEFEVSVYCLFIEGLFGVWMLFVVVNFMEYDFFLLMVMIFLVMVIFWNLIFIVMVLVLVEIVVL